MQTEIHRTAPVIVVTLTQGEARYLAYGAPFAFIRLQEELKSLMPSLYSEGSK